MAGIIALQDKMMALCLLTTDCDAIGGCTYRADGGNCSRCNRTNSVYILDPDGKFGLRVKCDSQTILDDMDRPRHFHTGIGWANGCRGWTPTEKIEPLIDVLIDRGFQPKLSNHYGRNTVTLYQGAPTPWGDGGEGDTWKEALWATLEKVCSDEGG